MDNGNKVTYIRLIGPRKNSAVYDGNLDETEIQFLTENIEDDELDHGELENISIDSESDGGETLEVLESVTIDQKRDILKKRTVSKKLIEKKPKNGKY